MPRPKLLPLAVLARFALFAAFAILTLTHPAMSTEDEAGSVHERAHRLRHRYRERPLAREPDGDFRESHQQQQHGLCSRCPPGFGVARRCTPVRDTVCHSCPPGYYAPGYSRKHSCWPCSRCGAGLYEARPCTGTSDTICDACGAPGTAADAAHGRQCRHLSNNSSRQHNNHGDNDDDEDAVANKSTRTRQPNGNFTEASVSSSYSFVDNDDDVAIGVTQIVAFQIVLIFTAVAAILALTCRLRVFINHETTFKIPESYRREDGISLIEHLSETS